MPGTIDRTVAAVFLRRAVAPFLVQAERMGLRPPSSHVPTLDVVRFLQGALNLQSPGDLCPLWVDLTARSSSLTSICFLPPLPSAYTIIRVKHEFPFQLNLSIFEVLILV